MITLYDTAQRRKRPFEPIRENEASIYVCGPTVYDDAHLGHARSALAFDLLKRMLLASGFKVTLAKNYTDIDDKIIKKLAETGKNLETLTRYYIERYETEMEALRVLPPDIAPKATEHIDAIGAMIETLLHKGCAYRITNGDIYFDTSKDPDYGSLSHKVVDDKSNQSRVTHAEEKRNPKDFALWKACGDNDVCFDTSVGSGRPGWHIECSAMIEKHFTGDSDYTIDIHGGGADLLFPHHENEAAQSRCATGKRLAKYWMHNGFVRIDGEKMSKSLGNSFFLKDALAAYDGEVLRYYLIGVHYRNDFDFNEIDLLAAKKRLDKLYRLKKRALPSKIGSEDAAFAKRLLSAMQDDLNISEALAAIDEMVAQSNDALDKEPKSKALKQRILGNIAYIDTLLGFGGSDPFTYFQQGVDDALKSKIEALLGERSEAKKCKDFARADAIREQLHGMGIAIMDTPEGTVWEKTQ